MQSINSIKGKGRRLTKQRKLVYETLSLFDKPATVQDIYRALNKNHPSVNLTSVYRTLTLLTQIGMIHEVEFGEGKKRYELVDGTHHHHLICNNCGSIEDVLLNEDNFINKIKIKSHFKIEKHSLEFFGLCARCQ